MEYRDLIQTQNIEANFEGELSHKYTFYIKSMFIKKKCQPRTQIEIRDLLVSNYPSILAFKNVGTGTITKCMKELSEPFFDSDSNKYYVIRKIGDNRKTSRYQLLDTTESIKIIWEKHKDNLLYSGCIEKGKLCIVSPSMYIFKLNTSVKFRRKKDESEEEYKKAKMQYTSDKIAERRKMFENHLKKMFIKDALFDISKYGKDKMVILINADYENLYAEFIENIFEEGT